MSDAITCPECDEDILATDQYMTVTSEDYTELTRFHMCCVYAILSRRAAFLIDAACDEEEERERQEAEERDKTRAENRKLAEEREAERRKDYKERSEKCKAWFADPETTGDICPFCSGYRVDHRLGRPGPGFGLKWEEE
jgi:hypothetical protein